MSLDTSGLQRYAAELGAEAQQAVRPAAQAGTEVLYRAAKANAQRAGGTGKLAASIYQAYSQRQSQPMAPVYHVSWRERSKGGARAPHGHFVEFGHWMYYAAERGRDGLWRTMVRPEMRGKPKPKGDRRTNRAGLDAYYVPLDKPKWVAAKPFIRPAFAQSGQALRAMEDEFFSRLNLERPR